ncbi:MAG: ATP-dependent Clp protease proteolytic subunit [Planctomycetota bacterium]
MTTPSLNDFQQAMSHMDLPRLQQLAHDTPPAALPKAWPTAHTATGPARDPMLDPRMMPAAAPPGGGTMRYREMTIDEMLLENRVIFLVGEIHHGSAMGVVMRLLYLQNSKPGVDINLYINSPGGAVDDTLAMIDTMQFISSPVATYCIGKAMSGGALTLAAGHQGKRYCLPHAKVMIHQPYGGIYGQTTDVQIQAEEIIKTKNELNDMLAKFTGQPVEKVADDSERDKFFNAEEAKAYGLVDEVVTVTPDADGEKKDD